MVAEATVEPRAAMTTAARSAKTRVDQPTDVCRLPRVLLSPLNPRKPKPPPVPVGGTKPEPPPPKPLPRRTKPPGEEPPDALTRAEVMGLEMMTPTEESDHRAHEREGGGFGDEL